MEASSRSFLLFFAVVCVVVSGVVAGVIFLRKTDNRSAAGSGNGGGVSTTTYLKVSKPVYHYGEPVVFEFKNDRPDRQSWIGIWQAHKAPSSTGYDVASVVWTYACGELACRFRKAEGTLQFDESTSAEVNYGLPATWPLCNGEYVGALMTAQDQVLVESSVFSIIQGNCHGICQKPLPTTEPANQLRHAIPQPHTPLSRLAFGSNFNPQRQIGPVLWNHVRSVFRAELWIWMGNVITNEADGMDMDLKRKRYNANKQDEYYTTYGPLANPKIPVTGTWDEHDSGYNNGGKEYDCYDHSQDEFAFFYDLPNNDPRHPAQGTHQQQGVYSAIPFAIPGNNNNNNNKTGIHLILLDVRTFRSPTFDDYGPCEGADSTMLGETQWKWLQQEMAKPSELKVIGSGVQVLSPTNQFNIDVNHYCAYENNADGFNKAIADLGESDQHDGCIFETWGQMPQERARLLHLAQTTINDGHAKRVIFLSGDLVWGELSVKEMPASDTHGPAQVIYELTSSGIDGNQQAESFNANRLKVRSADARGDGIYQYECQLPFLLGGVQYDDCTLASGNPESAPAQPWCSLATDATGEHIKGEWGYCRGAQHEIVQEEYIGYTSENGCTGSPFHVCGAQANYGAMEVNWTNRTVELQVFTPHATEPRAAVVKIDF